MWGVLLLFVLISVVTIPNLQLQKADPKKPQPAEKRMSEGFVDALYFIVVMISTVGFGDLSPVTPTGRMFVVVYSFLGIVLLSVLLGVYNVERMRRRIAKHRRAKDEAGEDLLRLFEGGDEEEEEESEKDDDDDEEGGGGDVVSPGGTKRRKQSKGAAVSDDALEQEGAAAAAATAVAAAAAAAAAAASTRRHNKSLGWEVFKSIATVLLFLSWCAMLVAFLEGWSTADALYFTFTTSTTVGYGDLKPSTMASKTFVVFFIPAGLVLVGRMVGQLSDAFMEATHARLHEEILGRRLDATQLALMRHAAGVDDDSDGDGGDGGGGGGGRAGRGKGGGGGGGGSGGGRKKRGVTELEFTQYMLLAMGKVDRRALDAVHAQFDDLDVHARGYIDEAALEGLKARGARKSVLWLPDEALLASHEFGHEFDLPTVGEGEEGEGSQEEEEEEAAILLAGGAGESGEF
jgi:uncharacterized membrane protein YgcG